MSFGGSSSSEKTQSQQTSNPVINQQGLDLLNQNVARSDQVSNLPFQPYTGQMTAPISFNEQLASAYAPNAINAGSSALGLAQNTAANVAGGNLLPGIQMYQNPYTDQVVNTSLNDLNRARGIQRVSDNQAATQAGAF